MLSMLTQVEGSIILSHFSMTNSPGDRLVEECGIHIVVLDFLLIFYHDASQIITIGI